MGSVYELAAHRQLDQVAPGQWGAARADIENLAQQVRHLVPRLQHHLLGNHLLENFKTLLIAGCFFGGDDAEAWRARGLAGLRTELEAQLLPDGAHNELAPMYHSIIAEGLLDTINIHRTFGLDCRTGSVTRHAGWSAGARRSPIRMVIGRN